jgi:hypothetical protein
VESIYNFIGKAHKTIDGIDRFLQILVQKADAQRERGAVPFGSQLAHFLAYVVE